MHRYLGSQALDHQRCIHMYLIWLSIFLYIYLSIYLSIPSSYLPFPHSIRPVTPVCIMISNRHIIWICCPCKVHTYIYIKVCILCIMYVMFIIWLFLCLVWDASAVHCAMPESWLQGTKPAIRMADIRWMSSGRAGRMESVSILSFF